MPKHSRTEFEEDLDHLDSVQADPERFDGPPAKVPRSREFCVSFPYAQWLTKVLLTTTQISDTVFLKFSKDGMTVIIPPLAPSGGRAVYIDFPKSVFTVFELKHEFHLFAVNVEELTNLHGFSEPKSAITLFQKDFSVDPMAADSLRVVFVLPKSRNQYPTINHYLPLNGLDEEGFEVPPNDEEPWKVHVRFDAKHFLETIKKTDKAKAVIVTVGTQDGKFVFHVTKDASLDATVTTSICFVPKQIIKANDDIEVRFAAKQLERLARFAAMTGEVDWFLTDDAHMPNGWLRFRVRPKEKGPLLYTVNAYSAAAI
jgi:hypothetical protein